jgi:hypothetical protein
MWALGHVNRRLLLRGHFRVRSIDLPHADFQRLRGAVRPTTAAFLAPNHPEFGFDWMMDKELSTYVAPRMASWAAHGIVATAPWFWARNNLVANDGGDDAMDYSVDWALRGHGVLAHPEGMVHWTADRIHPLFDGVAEMATRTARTGAARQVARPVYIVPVVWKLRYECDVSTALQREMDLIERTLKLERRPSRDVAARFAELQEQILEHRMARFGFDAPSPASLDFFDRQDLFRAHLIADLQSRYRVPVSESTERTIHRLGKAVAARRRERPADAALDDDAARVREAERLGGFSRECYDTPLLTQEQIGESLKRIRATLMRGGRRNLLHNLLPKPYGPRVAHVRVPEPIAIDATRTHHAESCRAYVRELTEEMRTRMQRALDGINAELATEVWEFSRPNPFLTDGAMRVA